MALKFGLQTGQQECAYEDLCRVWRMAEDLGFDMVFTSDHFYGIPPKEGQDVTYETACALTALALKTTRVRIGCMVFCVSYRNPALVAKIAATIDGWSGGRFELGLGAGTVEVEHRAYGYPFPPARVRMDMLEEAAQLIPAMLRQDQVTFAGNYFRAYEVRCTPRSVQPRIRLWIGGKGMRRIIPIAAKYADVWNGNGLSPEEYRERCVLLDESCERLGRNPATIGRSLNAYFHMGVDAASVRRHRELLRARGRREDDVLLGAPQEVVERLDAYARAGVHQINLYVYGVHPPFDWEALQCFAEEVMPVFR